MVQPRLQIFPTRHFPEDLKQKWIRFRYVSIRFIYMEWINSPWKGSTRHGMDQLTIIEIFNQHGRIDVISSIATVITFISFITNTITMVTSTMSIAHFITCGANVHVINGPAYSVITGAVKTLVPSKSHRTGPANIAYLPQWNRNPLPALPRAWVVDGRWMSLFTAPRLVDNVIVAMIK